MNLPMQRLFAVLVPVIAAAPLVAQTTIRVEIDYMDTPGCSHRPTQAEMDAVVAMFACQGINLIIDIDDAVPHILTMECPNPGTDSFFTCAGPSSFASYRSQFKDQSTSWHYCLFTHWYDDGNGIDSSGLAELPGNDLVVADGVLSGCSNAQPFWRAATFAHELGHNLGLNHFGPNSMGGNISEYAPNLPSVMAYRFQLRGVASQLAADGLIGNDHLFKELDFSSGLMPNLVESSLQEAVGLGIRPVDWDCSGGIGGFVNKNLDVQSDWCPVGADSDTLIDHDEWGQILSQPAPIVTDDTIPVPYVTCPGPGHGQAEGGCPTVPALTNEACIGARMIWVDPNGFPLFTTGSGSRPYVSVDFALSLAPAGSILYLQPGTQALSSPGPLVIDQPVVLAGPGGAVIDPN